MCHPRPSYDDLEFRLETVEMERQTLLTALEEMADAHRGRGYELGKARRARHEAESELATAEKALGVARRELKEQDEYTAQLEEDVRGITEQADAGDAFVEDYWNALVEIRELISQRRPKPGGTLRKVLDRIELELGDAEGPPKTAGVGPFYAALVAPDGRTS